MGKPKLGSLVCATIFGELYEELKVSAERSYGNTCYSASHIGVAFGGLASQYAGALSEFASVAGKAEIFWSGTIDIPNVGPIQAEALAGMPSGSGYYTIADTAAFQAVNGLNSGVFETLAKNFGLAPTEGPQR